jgi:YD repeat-containing protein
MGRAGTDAVAIEDGFQFGGWTLNVHHALEPQLFGWCVGGGCLLYAAVPKALYMGDGETREDADVQAATFLSGNILLSSEDGSEVYEFDPVSHRHLSTVRPMTGAKLYTFGYDANGYLATVTDASGNVTTIQRDASEHPTAIVAPLGQKTTLAVDANGYLSEVIDPEGLVTKLSNSPLGLIASLTDPKGNVYSYQYDTYGHLTLHADPASGFISAYTDAANGFSASEKTAMGVTSSYNVVLSNSSTSETEQYTDTLPDGLKETSTTTQLGGQINESTTLPDGSSYSDTQSGDPRWGIQVPIEASSKTTLGNDEHVVYAHCDAGYGRKPVQPGYTDRYANDERTRVHLCVYWIDPHLRRHNSGWTHDDHGSRFTGALVQRTAWKLAAFSIHLRFSRTGFHGNSGDPQNNICLQLEWFFSQRDRPPWPDQQLYL